MSSEPRDRARRAAASAEHEPGYPERAAAPVDRSRRRFLRQIGAGAGAAGFLSAFGLPRLGHGQSAAVDFSVLEQHPTVHEASPPPPAPAPVAEAPAAAAPMPVAEVPVATRPAAAASTGTGAGENLAIIGTVGQGGGGDTLADEAGGLDQEQLAEALAGVGSEVVVVEVTENRAMWLDEGYLVMLRWVRREGDQAPVAALEGASDRVSQLLADEVHATSDLHNVGRLHAVEAQIVALLAPLVAPARIEVLHLNHDCNTVCGRLDPGPRPDDPPLAGIAPPTTW